MNRRALLLSCSIWILAVAGQASAVDRPVRLGQIGVSQYAAQGAIVQAVLERLGHRVTVSEGTHEEIFPRLAQGEVDLLVAVRLPFSHAHHWERHGHAAVELATLYEGASLYWAVPAYVPPGSVASIADLAKSEVAVRMNKTLHGINPGAGSSVMGVKALKEYGLDAAGYTYRHGTADERWRTLDDAWRDRQWIVVPMGAPMFLNHAYTMRPLADPRGVLGGADRGVLVANRGWVQSLPERTLGVLRRVSIGLDAVSEMDDAVVRGGATPKEAAQRWMQAHAEQVDGWFGE